jgi:hypothetical protein
VPEADGCTLKRDYEPDNPVKTAVPGQIWHQIDINFSQRVWGRIVGNQPSIFGDEFRIAGALASAADKAITVQIVLSTSDSAILRHRSLPMPKFPC